MKILSKIMKCVNCKSNLKIPVNNGILDIICPKCELNMRYDTDCFSRKLNKKLIKLYKHLKFMNSKICRILLSSKSIIVYCLITLIFNAVYLLPIKTEFMVRKGNTVFSNYFHGYKYTTFFRINNSDLKNIQFDNGFIILIDYERLIFHSLLIIAVFGVFYMLTPDNTKRTDS